MENITKILKKEINKNLDKQIVLLCIGSRQIVGDMLGPAVGQQLMQTKLINKIIIKGNLENPIHYLNINENLMSLNKQFTNMYTIVVDASLYTKSYIGEIIITKNKIILGEALNKYKYKIGNIVIKGIVGEDCKTPSKNIQVLKNVPEDLIKKMSKKISNQILKAIN